MHELKWLFQLDDEPNLYRGKMVVWSSRQFCFFLQDCVNTAFRSENVFFSHFSGFVFCLLVDLLKVWLISLAVSK